jgi:polysaccharide export outer membrane protein
MRRLFPISTSLLRACLSLCALVAFAPCLPAQTEEPATLPDPSGSTSAASMLSSMDALNDHTQLGNGDRLSYRVVEERKDPVGLTISDSGELEVPLLGRYPAAGKTCKQLANELKPLLEKKYFYKATVIVGLDTLSTRPLGKVYLMGQVHAPGVIDIPTGGLTVSKAILTNGGLADFADRRRVKVLRKKADGSTETIVVDLKEILDNGHSEKDILVQPGDTINVPEKLINF